MQKTKTVIHSPEVQTAPFYYLPADTFPTVHPIDWLHSHFAIGGWSAVTLLANMRMAHHTRRAPQQRIKCHPHHGTSNSTRMLALTDPHHCNTRPPRLICC